MRAPYYFGRSVMFSALVMTACMPGRVVRIDAALGTSIAACSNCDSLEQKLEYLVDGFNTTMVRENRVGRPRPNRLEHGKPMKGEPIHAANFPMASSPLIGQIFAGAITLGYKATDLSQSAIDQNDASSATAWQRSLAKAAQPFNAASCDAAAAFDDSLMLDFGAEDIGNPPEPPLTPVYFEVPRVPDDPKAGTTKIFARIAFHREGDDVPTIIIVPGLFDSGVQNYIRNTASVMFSLGYHVVVIDQRDHGMTRILNSDAGFTMGLYEGRDILTISRQLTKDCSHRTGTVGALGFSFGGTSVIEAVLADTVEGGEYGLTGGALAVSPPLDIAGIVEWLETYASRENAWAGRCFNRVAIATYFTELIALRQPPRQPRQPERAQTPIRASDFLREGIAGYPLTYDTVVTDRTLQDMVARMEHKRFPQVGKSTETLRLAIIEAKDDPVVTLFNADQPSCGSGLTRADQKAIVAGASSIEGLSWASLFLMDRGGHMGFAAVSQPISRCFLRTFFRAWGNADPSASVCMYFPTSPVAQ